MADVHSCNCCYEFSLCWRTTHATGMHSKLHARYRPISRCRNITRLTNPRSISLNRYDPYKQIKYLVATSGAIQHSGWIWNRIVKKWSDIHPPRTGTTSHIHPYSLLLLHNNYHYIYHCTAEQRQNSLITSIDEPCTESLSHFSSTNKTDL